MRGGISAGQGRKAFLINGDIEDFVSCFKHAVKTSFRNHNETVIILCVSLKLCVTKKNNCFNMKDHFLVCS